MKQNNNGAISPPTLVTNLNKPTRRIPTMSKNQKQTKEEIPYWQTKEGKETYRRYARSAQGKASQKRRTKRYLAKLHAAKALAERMGRWE